MTIRRIKITSLICTVVIQAIAISLLRFGSPVFAVPGPSFIIFIVPFLALGYIDRWLHLGLSSRELEVSILVLNTIFLYFVFYFALRLIYRKRLKASP